MKTRTQSARHFIRLLATPLFLLVTSLSLAHLAHAKVLDHVEGAGLSLGRSLLDRLSELSGQDPSSKAGSSQLITLNGATLRVQSSSRTRSESSIQSIVNEVQAECQRSRLLFGGLAIKSPILERISDNEGFTACLKASPALNEGSLFSFVDDFSKNKDLSRLGTFQGIYVRAEGETLSLLAIEILEGFAPGRMFPEEGDSPGVDHHDLPRPAGRRNLSASLSGEATLTSYEVRGTPEEAAKQYVTLLRKQGVNILRPHSEESRALSPTFVARTPTNSFVVTAMQNEEQSTLILARLPQ